MSQRETAEAPHDYKIITISLYDENNNPISNDATVQVEGTDQVDDDDDGGYYINYCITGQYIVVIAPQYQQAHPEPCETGKSAYSIKLTHLNLSYSTSPNDSLGP